MIDKEKIKVIILCGGLGTRLREQTEFIPKPMVQIGNKPILWHIMKIFYHQGFREFILPLGYKGDVIKDYFTRYKLRNSDYTLDMNHEKGIIYHEGDKCENWKIHFVETGLNTNTAGRIYLIKKLIENDNNFIVTYGDGVSDIDLNRLIEFHKSKNVIGTVTGFKPFHRFGIIEEEEGVVKRFREKPQMNDLINCGFMLFDKKALDYFKENDATLEKDVLPRIAKDNQLAVYHHKGCWHYMDTQRDYEILNKIWEENPEWKIWKD